MRKPLHPHLRDFFGGLLMIAFIIGSAALAEGLIRLALGAYINQ